MNNVQVHLKNQLEHFPKIAFLIFVLATAAVAQDDQTASDRWAGMVINVSTPDTAIRLFGPPSKDKDKVSLDLPRPISWLSGGEEWSELISYF